VDRRSDVLDLADGQLRIDGNRQDFLAGSFRNRESAGSIPQEMTRFEQMQRLGIVHLAGNPGLLESPAEMVAPGSPQDKQMIHVMTPRQLARQD
jgi:hypothetical protein